MSSDSKDARWGLALHRAEIQGFEYEDFTYVGWTKALDYAQEYLDEHPDVVSEWAEIFRTGS